MSEEVERTITGLDLAQVVREESAQRRLATKAFLASRFPEADLDALLASCADECPDIASIGGTAGPYYYSTLSMTEAYATHLARVEDKDPLRLVAETVRDESRIYPRPTATKIFLEQPFSLARSELASVLLRLQRDPGTSDIRSCAASNGAVYLYSDKYLTESHAQGLTEYYEVERWQNP